MRLATIVAEGGQAGVGLVDEGRILPLGGALPGLTTMRAVAGAGAEALHLIATWAAAQPGGAWQALEAVRLGPAVPDPGAIYTVGLNDGTADGPGDVRPERPLIYAKLPTAVGGHGDTLSWDRSITANVDPEVELGVVIGAATSGPVAPAAAMDHVFGWTCINDVSSRDPWLDGDQWLLGKSMAGFCPVGPWIVTRDDLDPGGLRLGASINGLPVQDGHTSRMRFSVAEVIAFLSRHTVLRPGDLIASGTPARLVTAPGPDRHLEVGDTVSIRIEGIGELTTHIT